MAFRTDVSIDWSVSPRIIEVAAPSQELLIQDLYDTIAELQAQQQNLIYPILGVAGGKFPLGGGVFTAVSVELLDAKIKFADRAGPSIDTCVVKGGNLANPTASLEESTFVYAIVVNETGGVVAETAVSGLTEAEALDLANLRKVQTNRLHTDPATGILTIYDDDDVTPLFTANIYEDTTGLQPYRGKGLERREKLS